MIRIWVYDGILASGVAGPTDVFTAANSLRSKIPTEAAPISWRVESIDGRPVRTASGRPLPVDGKINPNAEADVVLLTAPFVAEMDTFIAHTPLLKALSSALRNRHGAGTVVATYCTGSYLLAEAGLLEGRIATTHWAKAADFIRRYPRVQLRADRVLTEQEGILCGGAATSFMDVALRLVAMLAGSSLAALTARTLLIDTNRVSQAPYAALLDEHGHTDRLVARAQERMAATMQQHLRLSELATYLAVSERTLSRRFKSAIGMAPLEYLQALRIEVAKRLLENGTIGFDTVSQRVGYEDPSTFRQLFKRGTGVSPREYQRRFARPKAD